MRRQDRAVTGMDEIEDILKRCEVLRLAIHDTPAPYLVPLNFGYARQGDALQLYFHCAHEGKKLDLLRAQPQAAFETDCSLALVRRPEGCACTMHYESIIGHGTVSFVDGDEKVEGLAAIMRQYAPGETFTFPQAALDHVTVFRLNVEGITAKRNLPSAP